MTSELLLRPLQLGALKLPNRMVMAPLTRMRAGAAAVPTALMAEYYRQHASAGVIITEGTAVSALDCASEENTGLRTRRFKSALSLSIALNRSRSALTASMDFSSRANSNRAVA